MQLLFVCNQGMHRSRTAAELFPEARYRGIYSNVVSEEDMQWAETVFVMEQHQRQWLAQAFPKEYLKKQIIVLDIPDVYSYNQPELKQTLKEKINAAMQELVA